MWLQYVWYGFVNGLIFYFNNLTANWFWIFGLVFFIMIYMEDSKEADTKFIDDFRDII